MDPILFIDTETGGIDPEEHDLLSVGLVCWNAGIIEDTAEIFIEFDRRRVTQEALNYNRFEPDPERTVNGAEAVRQILEFLLKNFPRDAPVTVGGHNVCFDVNFLKRLFSQNRVEYGRYFSHRTVDTASLLLFLRYGEVIREKVRSLDDAAGFFEIKTQRRHAALEDALITAEVFNRLTVLLKSAR